ncbi:hypothetical protein [Pontibacter sp. G13]|uniref:ammonium transporter n=1 Tax=Pontibacter sp. G13 TaxID=3074898 RepID=UPI00288B7047|nr:hypothetical protein [Pontibacter sp. G13]WNJ20115.1 hypothetical protein RJD25_06485 [Pontibacter sp. G13]
MNLRYFLKPHIWGCYAWLVLFNLLPTSLLADQVIIYQQPVPNHGHKEISNLESGHRAQQEDILQNTQSIQGLSDTLLQMESALNGSMEQFQTEVESEVGSIQTATEQNYERIERINQHEVQSNQNFLDSFWLLIAAAMVFLMQAGFTAFEVGVVRMEHRSGVGLKNMLDWLVVAVVFYLFGYSIMFNFDVTKGAEAWYSLENLDFFLFQLVFASTAVTIISGALAERTKLIFYFFIAIVVGGIIYPIVGNMVWGNGLDPNQSAYLFDRGFMDFAGSTVVHSVGAWVSLIGCILIQARADRFSDDPKLVPRPYNLGYSTLGVLILWFGWWGFNGGTNLAFNEDVSHIILNTNLAGAAGGISAFLLGLITYTRRTGKFQYADFLKREIEQEEVFMKLLGGVLGGLVAITASCNIVSGSDAILIGLIAGVVHNLAFDLLVKLKIDDPVGAIPVHGACGVLGTILVTIGNPFQFSTNQQFYQAFSYQTMIAARDAYYAPNGEMNLNLADILASMEESEDDYPPAAQIEFIDADSIFNEFLIKNYLPHGAELAGRPMMSDSTIEQHLTDNPASFPLAFEETFSKSVLPQSWFDQLIDQLYGILIVMLVSVGISGIMFLVLKPFGMRVSPDQEKHGEIL